MKNKLVCEVYCRHLLQTYLFQNDSISVMIGNIT